ncbi:hypothetical protein CYMTET_36365 [Cymbomonas tetramitiformis]|uniref:Uncharacterized protein n=1 Tax=Cymbomonas tetramitiformis TaxID=36881 RepID=A0AAE0CHC9_9CHLO|nr:hypothetical protein CYMTET_36365 [Cymbomonas tetramitiformis]
METRFSAKRKLLKEFDLDDSSIRLVDAVRDSPTVIVALKAEINTAGLDSDVFNLDEPTLVIHRAVNELVYDTLAYIVEPDSVAYGYLLGTDAVSDRDGRRALMDLIKGAADWTPTAATRKHQLWESLDPDFYAAIRGGTAGTAASAAVSPGDDIISRLFAKIERLENFIKSQRQGGAPAMIPKRTRKGLAGFRVGAHPDPQVGFDTRQKKVIPKCPRYPTAGDGHTYHTIVGRLPAWWAEACGGHYGCLLPTGSRLYTGGAAHSCTVPSVPLCWLLPDGPYGRT